MTTQQPPQPPKRPRRSPDETQATQTTQANHAAPTSPRSRRRARREANPLTLAQVQQLSPTAALLTPSAPKRWLIDGWDVRRALYIKRLGEWVAMTLARMQLTTPQAEALALESGEPTSQASLQRLARLRHGDADPATARERINLTTILWLATLAGQTLSDVDRYLRGGATTDLTPSLEARADTLRGAFVALSPARQQALEDFAQHLYMLDEAAQRPITLPGSASSVSGASAVSPASIGGGDPRAEVLAARAELEQALRRVQALEAGQVDETDDTDEQRRKRGNT